MEYFDIPAKAATFFGHARALLRGAPGAQLPPLRGLLFADVPAQPPFPIGMGAHAPMPEAPPVPTGTTADCLAGSC
ncbi:MAG: hypothetical protein LBU75_12115 [Desulfovibrio sp.]|jgi:hypothetical protein|nr:hypothetical protein [Desulfovibrio sp.]